MWLENLQRGLVGKYSSRAMLPARLELPGASTKNEEELRLHRRENSLDAGLDKALHEQNKRVEQEQQRTQEKLSKLPEEGVPSFLYGVVELNGSYSEKNEVDGRRDRNSGGHTVFLSPGIQWVTYRWVVEASLQIPIIQDLHGDALEADYALTLGMRFRF